MNIGDIVVRIKDEHFGMKKGDMAEIISNTKSSLGFDRFHTLPSGDTNRIPIHSASCMRLAKEIEIAAYRQGITNIKDIPEDFQITFIPLIWN